MNVNRQIHIVLRRNEVGDGNRRHIGRDG